MTAGSIVGFALCTKHASTSGNHRAIVGRIERAREEDEATFAVSAGVWPATKRAGDDESGSSIMSAIRAPPCSLRLPSAARWDPYQVSQVWVA